MKSHFSAEYLQNVGLYKVYPTTAEGENLMLGEECFYLNVLLGEKNYRCIESIINNLNNMIKEADSDER